METHNSVIKELRHIIFLSQRENADGMKLTGNRTARPGLLAGPGSCSELAEEGRRLVRHSSQLIGQALPAGNTRHVNPSDINDSVELKASDAPRRRALNVPQHREHNIMWIHINMLSSARP